ncbi:hypothetical protein ACROYT_G023559 [Oculina patagonica]
MARVLSRLCSEPQVKRTALTQQALRILRNTSLDLSDSKKAELLSEFSARMRASGYGARYRQEIITSAMMAFDRMKKDQEDNDRPINRPRSYQAKERRKKKLSAKTQWFKTGGYSTVMFVPATPGGRLANMLREVEERSGTDRGWRVKIVERGGQKMSSRLMKDPWAGPCNRADCLVCRSAETRPDRKRGGPCSRNSCCYLIECRDCKTKGPDTIPDRADSGEKVVGEAGKPMVSYYIGESARNGFTRALDHQDATKKRQTNNALGKHVIDYHNGRQVTFDMWITCTHKDPLTRQVQEGVNIVTGLPKYSGMEQLQMNSKLEYLQGAVPQTRTQRGAAQ